MIPEATDIVCRHGVGKCIGTAAGGDIDLGSLEAIYVIYDYFALRRV
jgi:hypothetical protein